jgi:hypothetical protein
MADPFAANRIELAVYTNEILVRGSVALPYRRVLDLLNSEDREYISIDGATISPLVLIGEATGPNTKATVIRRTNIILAGVSKEQAAPAADDVSFQRSVLTPCLGFIGAFAFNAHLPLLPGQRLLELMETQRSDFLMFYEADIYLAERPEHPPQHYGGLVVNRAALNILYLL